MKFIMSKNKLINILILSLFIMIFLFCLYQIFIMYFEKDINEESIQEIIEETITIDEENNEETIDWNKLKSINEDIVGWIQIEGTNINYPILKDKDLFYLNHIFDKSYNSNGSIFTTNESINNDEEITIYGHNMKNGSMFSCLGNYLDSDFLNSHNKIKIFTPDGNYEAIIFSAYSTGVNKEQNTIKDLNTEDRIKHYIDSSYVTYTEEISSNRIIKLVTCSYLNANTRPTDQRYYIIAYVVED